MSGLLDVDRLCVRYGSTEALADITFQIDRGDFVGLVGPNGGGKSTLAKAVLGLVPASGGKITLFGTEAGQFRHFEKIGYLPQKQTGVNALFPVSAEEVIALGLLSAKRWPKRITAADWQKIRRLMESLEIADLKGRPLAELSGGQQQKVLLGRALVAEPELLILDEPSSALDPAAREQFFARLRKLNLEAKTTIIMITHDTGYVGQFANKLLYIDRRLVFFGKIGDFCPSGEMASCFERDDHHIIWHQHD